MAKVAVFAPRYPPSVGGAAIYFEQVTDVLEETDFEPVVFAPALPGERERPNLPVETHRIFPQLGEPVHAGVKYLRRVDRLLKDVQPDVAHVHPHFPQYRFFRWLVKRHRVPRVYDCRDCHFNRRYVRDGQYYLSAADCVERILFEEVGVGRGELTRSPVVLPDIDPTPVDLVGKRTVAFVGELTPQKGIGQAVFAVLGLAKDQNIALHVAGAGPLESWVRGLDRCYGCIHFHAEVDHEDAVGLISAADVLTLPSTREARPRVVLEALANGTPVVASDVGDIPTIVGDAGEVVAKDATVVANALERVLSDESYQIRAHRKDVCTDTGLVKEALMKAYTSALG